MPTFRCTACGRRVESPVVIGAGDCPRCGGDVVFDLRGERVQEDGERPRRGRGRAFLRRLLGR
jgi:DNA-directed RNA polymerase subunit RPC12/RpoP